MSNTIHDTIQIYIFNNQYIINEQVKERYRSNKVQKYRNASEKKAKNATKKKERKKH